jgi:hypothetical protein
MNYRTLYLLLDGWLKEFEQYPSGLSTDEDFCRTWEDLMMEWASQFEIVNDIQKTPAEKDLKEAITLAQAHNHESLKELHRHLCSVMEFMESPR